MATPASGSNRAHPAADAERRVQPRHFHAGPHPRAAPSDGDRDAAQSDADEQPPAAMLYRHALESIFAFLRQGELVTALQVSRDWLAAVKSMASLQLEVDRPAASLFVVATSALGRHTAALGCNYDCVQLTADTLFILAHFMPQLRGLACHLSLPPVAGPLLCPAALRDLTIDLRASENITAADVNTVLRAISGLTALESLTIFLERLDPQISFKPLAATAQLRSLDINSDDGEVALSDAQADHLRNLPWLQQAFLPLMTTGSLRRLLRQPHDLQWQQISLPNPLHDEAAALLPLLPSLTKICCTATCERFDWLCGPNLRVVALSLGDDDDPLRTQSLVAGLHHCTGIESLSLSFCANLTAVHLAELLPRLTRLRELQLSRLRIDSLSFLAQPPMTDQLSRLHLSHCHQLPLSELRHVHALRSLRILKLIRSFSEPMDSLSPSFYEPPSLVLPQLEEFFYALPLVQLDDESEEDESDDDE